jgi:hypothetical protein
MDPLWDTLRRLWLDHQIVDYLEDIRDHVQLLLDERLAQWQLARNLQSFFAPPHDGAVLDVLDQYRNPAPVILVECKAHAGNEVLKRTPGMPTASASKLSSVR